MNHKIIGIVLIIFNSLIFADKNVETGDILDFLHVSIHDAEEIYLVKFTESNYNSSKQNRTIVSIKGLILKNYRGPKIKNTVIEFERFYDSKKNLKKLFLGENIVIFSEIDGVSIVDPQAPNSIFPFNTQYDDFIINHEKK